MSFYGLHSLLYIFLKYSNLLNQTHTIFSYFFMLSSDL
ncbi:hypothetical protein LEP1GSC073_1354 [Leptospira noguchii str. Cascata]|nr:hypothetical protein LEP1GSC073_1354 [Leptospira noguchii str. Cascata]